MEKVREVALGEGEAQPAVGRVSRQRFKKVVSRLGFSLRLARKGKGNGIKIPTLGILGVSFPFPGLQAGTGERPTTNPLFKSRWAES